MILSLPICPSCGAKLVEISMGPVWAEVKRRGGLDARDLRMRRRVFGCDARARETWSMAGWEWDRGCPTAMETIE